MLLDGETKNLVCNKKMSYEEQYGESWKSVRCFPPAVDSA